MPRARVAVVLAVLSAVLSAGPAPGQTTVYDFNGFELPTFTSGSIVGQQSFQTVPFNTTGVVQSGTVRTGTQAFQVAGPAMSAPGYSGTGANFWYRDTFTYNPLASGTPYVQVRFATRQTSDGFFHMPAAGVYLEAISNFGLQQGLVQVMIGAQGQVIVGTNAAVGGGDQAVTTANNLFPKDQWHEMFAELNFTAQTFRVYKEGDATPLSFQSDGGGLITDVPFRNSFGTSVSLKEIGMLAYNFNFGGGSETRPDNSLFIDNYRVTAAATPQSPVPEPSLMLAAGAGVLGLIGAARRRMRSAS